MQHDDPIDRAAGAVERWLASDPARRVELAELERLWGRAGRLLLGARIDGTWRALVAAGTRAPLAVADVAVEQSLSYGVGFADRRRLTAINPELDKYELGSARLSTFAPMMTWRSGRCVAYWTPVLAFFDGPRRPFASAWQLPEGALGLGSSTGSERISTAAGPRGLAAPIIPVIIHA